jgi:hypothetical protein
MLRRGSGDQRSVRQKGAAIAALLTAALLTSPAAATWRASRSSVGAGDVAKLCALMIRINTAHGMIKNKHFVPYMTLPPSQWKGLVDDSVAARSRLIALAPAEIKKAVTDEVGWFARVKANHYSKTTPFGSWTGPEINLINSYESTKCGISG